MRMRKLGRGQSVTFCVSPEMSKRIRRVKNLDDTTRIGVSDVIAWAISETWDEAVRSVPLWATQGVRHERQEAIWHRERDSQGLTVQDATDYLEEEALSLERLYRPTSSTGGRSDLQSYLLKSAGKSELDPMEGQVALIHEKCREFSIGAAQIAGNLQEEQERELAPEIEQERQVELPAPRDPATHFLHPDVKDFVISGKIKPGSDGFMPAFQAMAKSTAVSHFPIAKFPGDLLVTADFAQTVSTAGKSYCSDMYQRPVQWILTSTVEEKTLRHGMRMVVISQWEANRIKPLLSKSIMKNRVMLHAYLPRPSLTYRTLEDLKTYTIPPLPADSTWAAPRSLILQLNLFAGQLYLRSYDDYVHLCRYLGLTYTENTGSEVIAADGFVGRHPGNEECEFESSPVAFLNVVFKNIRRDSVGIEKTHMGRILAGEILRREEFVDVEGLEEMFRRMAM